MYGALAGGNITLGSNSELLLTDLGQVNAGGNITVGASSGIVFSSNATNSAVSTISAGGAININGGTIVRSADASGNGGELDILSANGTITSQPSHSG
jgi:hypothetical protein